MEVTHELYLDLVKKSGVQRLSAKKGDHFSRKVRLYLRSEEEDWCIPEGTSAVIRYSRTSDGASGIYDALPDDTPAYTIEGNMFTFVMVPQMLAAEGTVQVDVVFVSEERTLATFNFWIDVQNAPVSGIIPENGDYYNVTLLEQVLQRLSDLEQSKVSRTGDEMQADLDMAGYRLTGLKAPVDQSDAVNKEYVDQAVTGAEGGINQTEESIPEYWKSHLEGKIIAIRALQDAGGKDCFSFVVLTDMHHNSNLGKKSALLAAEILKQCGIKYALCLGDVRTRGLLPTKEAVNDEFDSIETMLAPIRDRLLQTQGNHDAGYGSGDVDGDGTADTYAYELTPGEMYGQIYRKVGLVGYVHFAENGSAYYIDDVSARVRYIILNTHCNYGGYALNENGTVKNPTMRIFRYTQSQYDFLKEDALATVPGENWSVVVASHVPINHTAEMPEGSVMTGVLNAYKGKTTYSGNYAGSGVSAPNYNNLFDKTADGFREGYRFSSSGSETADTNAVITNYIPVKVGQKLHIKGIATSVNGGNTYARLVGYDADKNYVGLLALPTQTEGVFVQSEYDDTVATYTLFQQPSGGDFAMANTSVYIRIGGYLAGAVDDVVITLDENIVEDSGEKYDAVNVSVDFSNAKGTLIGYWAGHNHADNSWDDGFRVITTRCDAPEENDATLRAERVAGTVTEQSFDVVTVNTANKTVCCTKIGAGNDRVINY